MNDEIITHGLEEGDEIKHVNLILVLTVDRVDATGAIECTDHRGQEWYWQREFVDRGINEGFILTEWSE